eukprot:TRINITY_DN7934_c1_g1_i2.p3 TRINITY_DN7934_c1_g1~~TRINITY_DN7934_c1_g1_i2.p3  ORF type:complete len:191 (-),score=-1.50 TRINITY_DN7934_c1_g1_i2:151-723(-)
MVLVNKFVLQFQISLYPLLISYFVQFTCQFYKHQQFILGQYFLEELTILICSFFAHNLWCTVYLEMESRIRIWMVVVDNSGTNIVSLAASINQLVFLYILVVFQQRRKQWKISALKIYYCIFEIRETKRVNHIILQVDFVVIIGRAWHKTTLWEFVKHWGCFPQFVRVICKLQLLIPDITIFVINQFQNY